MFKTTTLLLFLSLHNILSASGLYNGAIFNDVKAEADTLENFDDGQVELMSWADQDLNPSSWSLSNTITYHSSPYSLRLFGNTWKLESVQPRNLDSGSVYQVAAYIQNTAEIQGFGLTDSVNTLFYSFSGTEQLDPNVWITVYQGAFPNNTWNIYQLPVADDWLAKFGYLPVVKGIIFINDRDYTTSGSIYFDEIIDITNELPVAPTVNIEYNIGDIYTDEYGQLSVDVQFNSVVYDPDSWFHTFNWNFGDDSTSTSANPFHTFLVEDDHDYTVFLNVTDPTGKTGIASCRIAVDPGPSSFPVTMNFTGDIIFARRIQTHINQYGYQSLFDPTIPYLQNAADITVANLESPLTTSTNAHPTKPILLKGSPLHAPALKYGGIDIVTIANNHIIDYGLEGLQETQQVVRQNDVICFGAGADSYEALQPAFLSKSGLNFAFLGNSDRTGQYNNYQPYLDAGMNKPGFANQTEFNILSQINSVRNISDIVIMEMHSGTEYSLSPEGEDTEAEFYTPSFAPTADDREIRKFAIDSGADVVICHHPHVIHGFEVYKNKLIAHSLGNFIFDLDYPETYPSMILNAEIGIAGISKYTVTPVYIDDYVPKKAEGEFGLYLLDDLAAKSKAMDTYLRIDRENVSAEIVLDTSSIQPVHKLNEETVILNLKNGEAVSDPILLSKTGSISSLESIEPAASWKYRLGKQLIWFGNFEDEGCTLWEINNADEWYDTSQSHKGLRSLCQKRTAGLLPINTNLEENFLFHSDSSLYTLHTYIRTENLQSAGILTQFYQSRTATSPVGSAAIAADTMSNSAWKLYTADFELPSNADFINISLRTSAPQSGTSYSWFDDTGVIEWTEWQDYSLFTEVDYPNDYYWIQIKNSNQVMDAELGYVITSFKDHIPSSFETTAFIPDKFSLDQNYPNPFNPTTKISFEIPYTAMISLKIYDILGQEVKTIIHGEFMPGKTTVIWNGDNNYGKSVSSGIYFYRLESSGISITKKLMLLR